MASIPGSRGGVNSGGADGLEGSVGGCHSGGALGMTATGLLPVSMRCVPSCWSSSELLDTGPPQLPPRLAAKRWASLKTAKLGEDDAESLPLLPERGNVAAEPALHGSCLSRPLWVVRGTGESWPARRPCLPAGPGPPAIFPSTSQARRSRPLYCLQQNPSMVLLLWDSATPNTRWSSALDRKLIRLHIVIILF